MGSLLGKIGAAIGPLNNQGLTDPQSGTTTWGTPQQTLDRLNALPRPGGTESMMNPNYQAPTIQKPSFQQATQMGAQPGGDNAMSPGLTKAGKLVTLLTGGLTGALAGRAAQENMIAATGGRRAGGVGTGFMGGLEEPMQHAMQGAQLQLLRAQSQMVPTPYGQMPLGFARYMFPSMIRGQTQEDIAGKKSATQEDIANKKIASTEGIAAANRESREGIASSQIQGRMTVERMKAALAGQQVSRLVPTTDDNGQFVMRALNKYGKPMGDIDGALPPSAYLPKQSSTVEYKQMDDGSFVALPKSTMTSPVMPGGSVSRGTSAPAGGGGITPVASGPITDAQGNPLIGKGAVTQTTRTMVETAPKVTDLVNRIRGQINDLNASGELGPGMSRWNEFWSGKVGTDSPKFRALMTNTTLLSTLLMRMHMGARGGQQIMEHFDNMIGAGHQSAANMLATMDEIGTYANEVGAATPLPSNYGKSNQPKGSTTVNPTVTHVYNPKTGQLEAR